MTTINLRNIYPYINDDCFVEVSDEVAECMAVYDRAEHALNERIRYNKAYFSLDFKNSLEGHILYSSYSPEELYEKRITIEELGNALLCIPEAQSKRLYAHYILGYRKAKIARIEGISEGAVRKSIKTGLKNLGEYFKKFA